MSKYEVSEVICLKCFRRWFAAYPEKTPLKELECKCGEIGYVIKTGQTFRDVPDKRMLEDERYQDMVEMWGENIAMEKYRTFIMPEE